MNADADAAAAADAADDDFDWLGVAELMTEPVKPNIHPLS